MSGGPVICVARLARGLAADQCSASHRLQTPAPALYPQSTLALASIYLATRLATPPIPLPLTPVPWWTLFDASEDDLIAVCTPLLQLYKDWGADPVGVAGSNGAGAGPAIEGKKSSGAGIYDLKGGVKMSVWRRGGGLPVDKAGVRRLIPEGGGNGNGNGAERTLR